MAFVIHVLGWSGPLLESPHWCYLHLPAGQLARARSLLLLGDQALESLSPDAVRAWLAAGRRRALLSPRRCDAARLESWLQGGAIDIVCRERLAEALGSRARELELGLVAWPLDLDDWLPEWVVRPPAGGFVDRALRVLPRVRPLHDVEAWVRAAGAGSHWKLRRRLRRALSICPRELMQLHLLAQVEAADADEVARQDLAVLLGYADESSLGHAWRRALEAAERLRPVPE